MAIPETVVAPRPAENPGQHDAVAGTFRHRPPRHSWSNPVTSGYGPTTVVMVAIDGWVVSAPE